MASSDNSIKIHEHYLVPPPTASATTLSLPLTFFDLVWLRFHPVERIFFYTLPAPQSHPSNFYEKVLPKLKASLSLTLQHFLPLAGKVVWPSDSHKPLLQFNPGDGVSLVLAQSDDDAEFNRFLDNSPRDAKESRKLVPHLESSNSVSSVISLQITLFPNRGFCIGISSHHAVLDGKSSIMFIKSWAYVCKSGEDESSSPCLVPELEPLFDRELVKDPSGLESVFINQWTLFGSKMDPSNTSNGRSLKILSFPMEENSVRATFELTREDLDKLRKRVLSKWELAEETEQDLGFSKPTTLSTFVTSLAYVSVCIAKAIHEAQNVKKFGFAFTIDCRARLEPPIPHNYFGNCVVSHIADTQQDDFIKEGVVIVAKRIWSKIKMLDNRGALDGVNTMLTRFMVMVSEGIKVMAVAGSNRFGIYETDFGWGKPAKVEITSIDRGLNIGLAESKDGTGGVELGLVMNKHVMDLFHALFHEGLRVD